MQPKRRSYSQSFKAQVIQECVQPGASIAGVALRNSLNANLVHKWIRVQAQKNPGPQPAFIPLPIQTPTPVSSVNISVEILHPGGTVKLSWPTHSAAACAAFLKDLLMIRIDAIWLATEPMDMRAGTETALARMVALFGTTKPHCA